MWARRSLHSCRLRLRLRMEPPPRRPKSRRRQPRPRSRGRKACRCCRRLNHPDSRCAAARWPSASQDARAPRCGPGGLSNARHAVQRLASSAKEELRGGNGEWREKGIELLRGRTSASSLRLMRFSASYASLYLRVPSGAQRGGTCRGTLESSSALRNPSLLSRFQAPQSLQAAPETTSVMTICRGHERVQSPPSATLQHSV